MQIHFKFPVNFLLHVLSLLQTNPAFSIYQDANIILTMFVNMLIKHIFFKKQEFLQISVFPKTLIILPWRIKTLLNL
jgi:hypothetical protein